ncbi:MAG: PAS domain S-box protein [Bacteroidetes bacterium]|nr:PAS domain S-box protein [Bacteroidota bacterium]
MGNAFDTSTQELCEACASCIHTRLEEREACFISILDNIHDSVFSVDKNYRILTANKGFRERTFALTGIDFMPGDSILINGKYQHVIDQWIRYIQKAMHGEAFKVETEFDADGETLYREASFTPILQGGEIIGVSCHSKDISDIKQTQERLKEQNLLFRTLLENSHDGIAMLSAGGRLKYISPSVGRILGYTFEEMFEIGTAAMVHPDDLEAVIRFSEKLVPQYGKSDQIVYRMRTKAGDWKWVHCHYHNMLHEPSIKAFVVNYEDITDAKLTELQMDFDRRNRDALINSISDPMWSITPDMRLITANDAFLSVVKDRTGIDINPGDTVFFTVNYPESYLEYWVKQYNRVLSGETFIEVVQRVRPIEYWAEISFTPIWENGKVIGAACYLRDITKSKKAERLLLQNQQMMADAESIAHIGSWEHDLHNLENLSENALRWSDEVFRIFGYEPGGYEVSNENFYKAVHPDDREPIRQAAQNAIAENSGFSIDHRIIRPDGEVRWVHEEAKIIMDESTGTLIKKVGTVLDITEKKAAEDALRKSEEQYRQIVETAQEGISVIDEDDRTTYVNNKMCEILGYSKNEMIGKRNYDFMDEETKKKTLSALKRRRQGKTENYDIQYITKTGKQIWANISASPIFAEDGTYKGALGMITDITDRKVAEESVRRSNERYELATKATKDAIWDWNLLTDDLYWSEGYESLFGYSREEEGFTFETCTKRIHPDDFERVRSSLQKEINDPSSRSWHGEYRYIKSDGSIANVYNRGYIVYNEDGIPVRMVGAMQDITAQKLAEASLKRSNERYELATKATKDAIWDWNLLTNDLYWSEGYESLFGYSREEEGFTFETCAKRIHPKDSERVRSSLQKEINDPSSHFWQSEFRYIKADGSSAYVHDRGYIVYNEDGKPVRMVGAMQDITTQKLAEASLHKSEANLRTIFDHADRAFILLDKNFRILSFNGVANEWAKLAYKAEFQEGKSMISYLDAERKEEGQRILESVLTGQAYDHEMNYQMPDGSAKWFRVRRYPVRNEDGAILGVCIATKDSTKRKNFELDRDKMNAEIVRRNKDLEQFVFIVSHNLRAPVANIIGFSDALLQEDLNEVEKQVMVKGLGISIKKLDTVILDLNDIVQVKKEVGEMKEPVRFSMLVDDIALSIGHVIKEEHVVIKTDFEQVDEISSLRSYLYSIFYNLISNSIKYRKPDAPPLIEIKSRRLDDKIELCFSDNGLGIDLQKKNGQIFGLYQRFHPQAAEGKGMGLFMVKMQVENLGGTITVDSTVNVGSEFKICFDC